ncbi:uncharacterized protein LOC132268853 [Cornus florida]|uniref:uncharacterized protein LOC132268853 n=1 Tax=Cornus florida TaxID=4283 RepID=UPI00289CA9FC|nr:uncharacterized protein LOC132268853 [Cornus florida]
MNDQICNQNGEERHRLYWRGAGLPIAPTAWNGMYLGAVINYCNFADNSLQVYPPHYMSRSDPSWQNHNFDHTSSEKNIKPKITYEGSLCDGIQHNRFDTNF